MNIPTVIKTTWCPVPTKVIVDKINVLKMSSYNNM